MGCRLFENVIFAQHRIVELDLGVIFLEFLANFGVADHSAACDQAAQLVDQDLFLYSAFEQRDGEVVLLQQFLIFCLSDEVSPGEKGLGVAAVLQFVADVFVRRTQAEVVSLRDQDLPLD